MPDLTPDALKRLCERLPYWLRDPDLGEYGESDRQGDIREAAAAIAALMAERDAMATTLKLIADHDGMTLLAGSLGDDGDRAHQIGANKAFNQMAEIAKSTLSRSTERIITDDLPEARCDA
jgi:hypothetical protein